MQQAHIQNSLNNSSHLFDIHNKVQHDLERVLAAIKNNTYENAIDEYNTLLVNCEKIIEINSEIDWYSIRFILGNIYYRLKNLKKEEEICRALLAQNPKCIDACEQLAYILEETQNYAESVKYYQTCLDLMQDANNPEYFPKIEEMQNDVQKLKEQLALQGKEEIELFSNEKPPHSNDIKPQKKKRNRHKKKALLTEEEKLLTEIEELRNTLTQDLTEEISQWLFFLQDKEEALKKHHLLHEVNFILANRYILFANRNASNLKEELLTKAIFYLNNAAQLIFTEEKDHLARLNDIIIIFQDCFLNTSDGENNFKTLCKNTIEHISSDEFVYRPHDLNTLNRLFKTFQESKQDTVDIVRLLKIILKQPGFSLYYSPQRQIHLHWTYAYYCVLLGKQEEAQEHYDIINASPIITAHKILHPTAFDSKPTVHFSATCEAHSIFALNNLLGSFNTSTTSFLETIKKTTLNSNTKKTASHTSIKVARTEKDIQKIKSDISKAIENIHQKIIQKEEITKLPYFLNGSKIQFYYAQKLNDLINYLMTQQQREDPRSIIKILAETALAHLEVPSFGSMEEEFDFSYKKLSCNYALFIVGDIEIDEHHSDKVIEYCHQCLDFLESLPLEKRALERLNHSKERISYILGKLYFHKEKHSLALKYYAQAWSLEEFQTLEVYSQCVLMAQSLKKDLPLILKTSRKLRAGEIVDNILYHSKVAHEKFKCGVPYTENYDLYYQILNILYCGDNVMFGNASYIHFTHILALERIIYQGIETANYENAMQLAFLCVDVILREIDKKEHHIPILCQYVRLLMRDIAISSKEKAIQKLLKAQEILFKAISIAPESVEAHFELAWLYQIQEMNNKALEHYNMVCALESAEGVNRYSPPALGHKALLQKDYALAIMQYENSKSNWKALDFDSLTCANFYACLGYSYENTLNFSLRDEAYAQAKNLNPYYQKDTVINSQVIAPVFIKNAPLFTSVGTIHCGFHTAEKLTELSHTTSAIGDAEWQKTPTT